MDSSVTMVTDTDWKSWRVYVLKELERLNCNLENLRTIHTNETIAEIEKVKASIQEMKDNINYLTWRTGLFAGAVSVISTVCTVVILLFLHVKLGA